MDCLNLIVTYFKLYDFLTTLPFVTTQDSLSKLPTQIGGGQTATYIINVTYTLEGDCEIGKPSCREGDGSGGSRG